MIVLLGAVWHWMLAGLAIVGVGAVVLGWTSGALDRNGKARQPKDVRRGRSDERR